VHERVSVRVRGRGEDVGVFLPAHANLILILRRLDHRVRWCLSGRLSDIELLACWCVGIVLPANAFPVLPVLC
jgi:hypothetical protein